jgi:hypothetical protein
MAAAEGALGKPSAPARNPSVGQLQDHAFMSAATGPGPDDFAPCSAYRTSANVSFAPSILRAKKKRTRVRSHDAEPGYWYTSGYCHLRQDLRTFRVDRITALEPVEQTFERPQDFDVLDHVLSSIAMVPGSLQVEVLMETSIEHAQQVVPPILGKLESTEKGIIFRSTTAHMTWIAHFLINLDFPVFVIQPDELRQKLRQIATRALEMAGEQSIVKTIKGGNHGSEGSSFNNN